ncbi:MAG: hypothetical protein ACR2HD_07290 [Solirubrobacteraceae bacterium]|nr:MAG: hypothetical protein DLM63_07895 [Solirubrobacterales bacterium]
MDVAHAVVGFALLALNVAAGIWGAVCWYLIRPSRRFWPLLRAAQAAVLVQAVFGGVLLLAGDHVAKLHILYGLLPIVVSFVAEQLRINAAQSILDARGYASAQAVGEADELEQRFVVQAILRREMGVMAASALVIVGLAARAAFGSGGV